MARLFTAVYQKVPEGYIGFVEEIPGANAQGDTLDETRANLQEALALILDVRRKDLKELGDVIREPLTIAIPSER